MPKKQPELLVSRGGTGGAAQVGEGGYAVGGPGGHAGGMPGIGGDGGGADSVGDIVAGGAGGSVDGANIWFPPAVSGYEVYMKSIGQRADPLLKPFGRGGATHNYLWRFQRVEQVRAEFFAANNLKNTTVDEDILAMPLARLNEALAEAGEDWLARINEYDQYVFYRRTPVDQHD